LTHPIKENPLTDFDLFAKFGPEGGKSSSSIELKGRLVAVLLSIYCSRLGNRRVGIQLPAKDGIEWITVNYCQLCSKIEAKVSVKKC
jgi:hypothetical protein